MYKWHFVLFSLISSFTYAQVNVDSLRAIWQSKNLDDTIRLQAIHQIAFDHFLYKNTDSSIHYATKQFEYAKDKGLKQQMGLALNTIGNAYSFKQDFIKAMSNFRQSLSVRQEIKDKKGIAGSLINMGSLYTMQGQFPKALIYLKKGIAACDQIGEQEFKANALTAIANIYTVQAEWDLAKEYIQQSKAIYDATTNNHGKILALYALGFISAKEKDYKKALAYYEESLELAKKKEDNYLIVQINMGFGGAYYELGSYAKAFTCLKNANLLSQEIGHNTGLIESEIQIANIYLKANKTDSAIFICNNVLENAKQFQSYHYDMQACECLYSAYKLQGNGNKALAYHEEILRFSDSINIEETTKKLQQMEFDKQLLEDSLKQAEAIRIIKKEEEKILDVKKRKNRIQYSLTIIIILILAIIIAMASRVQIGSKLASGLIFIFFILTFEFLLVVLDPWIDSISNGEVGWKIAINTVIALVLFGVHQISEKRLRTVLIKTQK
ncbi:MAG: tetratricopeptide repeat protein [Bacteroidia bacterium]